MDEVEADEEENNTLGQTTSAGPPGVGGTLYAGYAPTPASSLALARRLVQDCTCLLLRDSLTIATSTLQGSSAPGADHHIIIIRGFFFFFRKTSD